MIAPEEAEFEVELEAVYFIPNVHNKRIQEIY